MMRQLVPLGGLVATLGTAAALIFVITLRPWTDANHSYDTHLNFRKDVPGDYTRTDLTWVDGETPDGPPGWIASKLPAGVERGRALFVAVGCGSCHGVDAAGAAVGPSLLGASKRRITTMARNGIGGMPSYRNPALSESDLDAIISYITSLGPASEETPPATSPTATPWPTSTPFPSPTAPSTPRPTAPPVGTPEPTSGPVTSATPAAKAKPQPSATAIPSPTPTAVPSPTSKPMLGPRELEAAQRLFLDVGCDICHGPKAEGTKAAPKLRNLTADDIRRAVRQGLRSPDSPYPQEMKPFDQHTLSDEELDQIIYYLQSLNR